MINIEITTKIDKETGDKVELISLNGIPDENLHIYDGVIGGTIENIEIIDIITNLSPKEFYIHFWSITYCGTIEAWENPIIVHIFMDGDEKGIIPKIVLTLESYLGDWARPYSYGSFKVEFDNVYELFEIESEFEFNMIQLTSPENSLDLNAIEFYFQNDSESTIKSAIDAALEILNMLTKRTINNLLSVIDKDIVLSYFQFPDEYKTACKQYLIYFTQFIADIGIVVDTEIKEEAKQTLFKIIPQDKNEGLDRIREALNIYLQAASINDNQAQMGNSNEIAVWRWQANISHLNSQIQLANSIIQAKDATIEALNFSNYQLKQILHSKDSSENSRSNSEEIISGIVKVDTLEKYGVSINLGELFRMLKRKLTSST